MRLGGPPASGKTCSASGRQANDNGPSASLAPSAARSTYREYASRAAFGRRLAAGPFSFACGVGKGDDATHYESAARAHHGRRGVGWTACYAGGAAGARV